MEWVYFFFLFVNIHLSNSQSHHLQGVHTCSENNTQASAPGKKKLLANHFALLETLIESGFIVRKWWCCLISLLQSVRATVGREILPPTVQGRACYANSEFWNRLQHLGCHKCMISSDRRWMDGHQHDRAWTTTAVLRVASDRRAALEFFCWWNDQCQIICQFDRCAQRSGAVIKIQVAKQSKDWRYCLLIIPSRGNFH